jgi:SAM-dependent methyltransferase
MKDQADRQAREREHFDRLVASIEDTSWINRAPAASGRLKRRATMIAQSADAWSDPEILELGCGTGSLTRELLKQRPRWRITAGDISPVAVEIAQKNCSAWPHVKFEVSDSSAPPYGSDAFDLVVGSSILHHLPAEQTLRDCFRVLRPDGMIAFIEPNMMNPHIAVEKNFHFIGKYLGNTEDETAFFRWRLSALLKRIGFDRVEVRPYDFVHPLVPKSMVPAVTRLSGWLEMVPLVKEISGDLWITAYKPQR